MVAATKMSGEAFHNTLTSGATMNAGGEYTGSLQLLDWTGGLD